MSHGLVPVFLCLCFLSFRADLPGQSSHQIFEHLTTEYGLSSNKVEAVLQDRDGFYWIATQNGLNRFDGSTFKIYRHHSIDSTSLTHNYCTGLVEGRNGDIWVATYKGVSRFCRKDGHFQPVYLHHPTRNFEITNRIYALAVDSTGNIWIAGNGFWNYDVKTEKLNFFDHISGDSTGMPPYSLITQLVYDPQENGLWLITGNELVFYSISHHQFFHRRNNPKNWKVFDTADSRELALDRRNRLWYRDRQTQCLSYFDCRSNQITITSKKISLGVKQISPDERGRIWIFYWLAAAEIYDPALSITDTGFFTTYHLRSALSEQGNALFIDHHDNHWISSDKGISIYNEANQYYKLYLLHEIFNTEGHEPVKINALAQTEPGYLWIATNTGLLRYDLALGSARQVPVSSSVRAVTTLLADGQYVWLGVYDHLICIDAKTGIVLQKIFIGPGIFFIQPGQNQDLWIGLWSGGLYQLDRKTGALRAFKKTDDPLHSVKSNNLICGLPDSQYLWVGYNAGVGFSQYDMAADSWLHFHPQENDLLNSNAGTVTVLTKADTGPLWLGTHGSGVFRFDPIHGRYDHFEQLQGLSSNYINSILLDNLGHLWISTADGINYLNPEKNSIRSLDMGLIFSNNDFAANGLTGLNGKLYFFCGNTFAEVDPDAFTPDQYDPQLVISSFKIFDQEMRLPQADDKIRLTYRQNFFSFEYSVIKTHPHKEVNYAYKLEGFDKEWHAAGHQHFASYTNVPAGRYRFMVKAAKAEGPWSNPLFHLDIQIQPPFWRTWWFIAFWILALVFSALSIYRYRMHQMKKFMAVRAKISQDLHDEVGSVLSSIHIYSTVADRTMEKNPETSKGALQVIRENSKQVMENMSDIVWAIHAGKQSSISLEKKLKNYSFELLTPLGIITRYEIDPEVEKKLVNMEARKNILLIVKEAMNNIARHSQATTALIRLALMDRFLIVQIEDNGPGFDTEKGGGGHGLSNMKRRTMSLGGQFTMLSGPNRGTVITCTIPVTTIREGRYSSDK